MYSPVFSYASGDSQFHWIVYHIKYNITFVRFLASMYPDMFLEAAPLRESLVAHMTFIWLFSSMYYHMLLEIVYSNESFITHITFVQFFFSMYLNMVAKIAPLRELLVAHMIFIWFFPSMHQEMFVTISRLRESFITQASWCKSRRYIRCAILWECTKLLIRMTEYNPNCMC